MIARIELPPLMGLTDTVRFTLPRLAAAVGAKGVCLIWRGARYACGEADSGEEKVSRVELPDGVGELVVYGATLSSDEASSLASFCERVFLNAEEYETILETAAADSLTGLPNRKAFMERLTEEVARAERTGSCFSVVFLDVDNLKKVNDTLGHPAGDDLLKGVAAAVRHSVRRSDVVARYGGDEFIVLLCETGPEDAAAAVRRILDEVSHIQVGNFHVEVSAGVASYPADGTDAGALIATADTRMYKEKGKKKEGEQRL